MTAPLITDMQGIAIDKRNGLFRRGFTSSRRLSFAEAASVFSEGTSRMNRIELTFVHTETANAARRRIRMSDRAGGIAQNPISLSSNRSSSTPARKAETILMIVVPSELTEE